MSIDHRVRPKPWRLLALGLALASAALLTGCDSATGAIEDAVSPDPDVADDPEGALRDAVAALGGWEGIEAALSFEVDDAVRSQGISAGNLSADEVELLLGWSIVVRVAGLDDPDESGFETSVSADDSSVFDLLVTDGERVFLRLDVGMLSGLSEERDLGDLDDLVVAARGLGLGDAARALTDGRWIELLGVEQLSDPGDAGQADDPEVDDGRPGAPNERIAASLDRFVDQDVEVSHIGSEDLGERVRMTTDGASLEELVDELITGFDRAGLLEDTGAGDLDGLDLDADAVVSMDAWIDGGELRQLALDLDTPDGDDELPGSVFMLIALDEFTGAIIGPEDAEPFDISGLLTPFLGGDRDRDVETFAEELFGEFDDDIADEDGSAPACVTQEELDLIEEFEGQGELEELEQLFDAGVLQRC